MDGITLRSTHNAYELPDHVKLVVELVRGLSNKCVLMPSLNKIEINLLKRLKDFHHRARNWAAKVHLREKSSHLPTQKATNSPTTQPETETDSWQEPDCGTPEDDNHFCGFDTDLYNKISLNPEVASQHKKFKGFLDKLELYLMNSITSLRKNDAKNISNKDTYISDCLHLLANDPDWALIQSDKTGQWMPMCIKDYILTCISTSNDTAMIPHSILDSIYQNTLKLISKIEWHLPTGNTNSSNHWSR